MKRTPLRRLKPMRQRARRSRYARRQRDSEFMLFVKGLPCSVEEERPDMFFDPTPCEGPIEADHAGRRPLGRKADDRTCIPLCRAHHRQRTDHTGAFKHMTKEQAREWINRAILRTQTMFSERQGEAL